MAKTTIKFGSEDFNSLTKEQQEIAKKCGYVGLFSKRNTIQEAYNYACMIARASDSEPHVLTAIHILMNTIAIKHAKGEY